MSLTVTGIGAKLTVVIVDRIFALHYPHQRVPPPQASSRLASAEAAEKMVRAMIAVSMTALGTGRRAPVEGVTMAMKTGTAGNKASRSEEHTSELQSRGLI